MKKLILLLSVCAGTFITPAFCQSPSAPKTVSYGQSFNSAPNLTPLRLSYVLKDKTTLDNATMLGWVTEVCQKEGCWLKLTTHKTGDKKEEVLVKIKDHAFSLPQSLTGKQVLVYGSVEKQTQSVKEQQHYLEDSHAPQAEIDAVTQPKESYVFTATGVKVLE